eukprot:8149618-Pyramimonas_sp.AAC.1
MSSSSLAKGIPDKLRPRLGECPFFALPPCGIGEVRAGAPLHVLQNLQVGLCQHTAAIGVPDQIVVAHGRLSAFTHDPNGELLISCTIDLLLLGAGRLTRNCPKNAL